MNIELPRYFLPEGILEYFDIVDHKSTSEKIHFYLEENNIFYLKFSKIILSFIIAIVV